MPRIHTIHDRIVDGDAGGRSNHDANNDITQSSLSGGFPNDDWDSQKTPPSAGTAGGKIQPQLFHLTTLVHASSARSLLERVVNEFLPIIQRRKYHVTTVSEMCCCGDGLDAIRKRKLQRSKDNILGYNQSITSTSSSRYGAHRTTKHEIHLRLRHPADHSRLYLYEDVAGTMAHELAHCERGPHDAKFFQIMEGILDEHAALMASRLNPERPLDPSNLPFAGTGQRLGGSARSQSRLLTEVGRTLGGGPRTGTESQTPREAAAAAAEWRQRQLRLRGTRCCVPCVIEILDDDSEQESNSNSSSTGSKEEGIAGRPASALSLHTNKRLRTECIDLTVSDDDEEDDNPKKLHASPVTVIEGTWCCTRCTFRNSPMVTRCSICEGPRGP